MKKLERNPVTGTFVTVAFALFTLTGPIIALAASPVQVALGNGQVVNVDAFGNFTTTAGVSVSNSSVAAAKADLPPLSWQKIKTIVVNLGEGSSDDNVTILQQFLIAQHTGKDTQALADVGATSYFGVLTRAALAEFQAKAGISPALGNFGPITRAYMSSHY